MKKTFSGFQKKTIIKISLVILVTLFLYIFDGFNYSIGNGIEKLFSSIKGSTKPDSSIVLITITGNDIDMIGPWPVKRSYYALLIKSLTNLNVEKIGLEIFLSSKFSSQAIYDNLLTREINKSGRVVLGSVAGKIISKNKIYYTDSLSLPSPKLIDESIPSGHLNYIENNGRYIPLEVKGFDRLEEAFSLKLSGLHSRSINGNAIKINFISSWKDFTSYSMLEFFNLVNSSSSALKSFKDKIVIIGITDPQVAAVINSNFDDDLPGLALHAFAVDNLLKDRSLNYNYINISKIIFAAALILLLVFERKGRNSILFYTAVFVIFLIVSYVLFNFFYVQLSYSFFILPVLILLSADAVFAFTESKEQLKGIITEKDILNNLLKKKEDELSRLQKELDVKDGTGPDSLLEKIKKIKSDILRIREKEEDETAVENFNSNEVKNFYGIIFRSRIIAGVAELIKKTAPEEANILILGESGTGKELAAKAVHQLSKRNNEKFVAVNCGALSDSLLESELFGHVKGAFTGAIADKIGRFEAADNGTIFLDEIAETSENFQVKLLRIIQTGDYEKVGSAKTYHTNVRIIAATNKNIEEAVRNKKFREDLYYRLNVIKVELPPLRERKEDIEVIARHFLSNEDNNINFSRAALDALNNYRWRGNVRELEGIIKRAVIFAKSSGRNLIQLSDLPEELVKELKFNFEDLVIETLRSKKFSHSSINETAKELGNVSRTLVSENFRGYTIKLYFESNFNSEKAAVTVAGTNDEEIVSRVKSKLNIFLNNIRKDLTTQHGNDFKEVKEELNSKYKNLPQKFHYYLDEIIKHFLSS